MLQPQPILPQELLMIIAGHLETNHLKNFRTACRSFCNASWPAFRIFFNDLKVSLDSESLTKLGAITKHEKLNPYIHALSFDLVPLSMNNFDFSASQLQKGKTTSLLSACLSRLKGCDTIDIRIRDDHFSTTISNWFDLLSPEQKTAGFNIIPQILFWIVLKAVARSSMPLKRVCCTGTSLPLRALQNQCASAAGLCFPTVTRLDLKLDANAIEDSEDDDFDALINMFPNANHLAVETVPEQPKDADSYYALLDLTRCMKRWTALKRLSVELPASVFITQNVLELCHQNRHTLQQISLTGFVYNFNLDEDIATKVELEHFLHTVQDDMLNLKELDISNGVIIHATSQSNEWVYFRVLARSREEIGKQMAEWIAEVEALGGSASG
jgi:hypothetical protein